MVSVFFVFIGTGVTSIKEIGLGNAVAIGIDATLVRLVLMPAAMRLLGRWNWWLPRPLEWLLPTRREAQPDGELGYAFQRLPADEYTPAIGPRSAA